MKFKLPYDRTLASTCGISIEFKKDEYHLVPPAMYKQVREAGGVPEDDAPAQQPASTVPQELDARRAAMFAVFEQLVTRNDREDFTAGNAPTLQAVTRDLGWAPTTEELKLAWGMFVAESGGPKGKPKAKAKD